MIVISLILPVFGCLLIALGLKPLLSARCVAILNLLVGLYAAYTWSHPMWSLAQSSAAAGDFQLTFGFLNGVSALMLALSVIVSAAAVMIGQAPIGRERLYYSSVLLMSAGIIGAFISRNLIYFFAFHELALIPTFLMIGLMGRGQRKTIAWKITIYLSAGSMILLAGLVWLATATGTNDMAFMITHASELSQKISFEDQRSISALLIIGFGTLVSLFPFHSWAAPAYASAPASVSMLHAGVIKKFGLYGLMQLALPLLPEGMKFWLTPLLVLLLGNVLWVGLITVNQKRWDLMLGHSSVMHMGYVFLALAAMINLPSNQSIGTTAACLLMFGHGVTIALLFGLISHLQQSLGSLDFDDLGGLGKVMPVYSFLIITAGMASIGLPGLANFAGEFMVFIVGFRSFAETTRFDAVTVATVISMWGVVLSAVYMLRAIRNSCHGTVSTIVMKGSDLTKCEMVSAWGLTLVLLAVGLFPNLLTKFILNF